jgi:NADH dehydrogenase [ubiquinone] 1 alpha subcomplex assembly factor 7
MTPLAQILARRIASEGPMPLSAYMADCLLHPAHGYYTTRDPFGAAGDFITAPEISQMFGEMLGLCLAQAWLDQGAPPRFTLAELGPGRGTLMADVLRATRGIAGFHAAADVMLVEASPVLRAVQARAVPHARWADTVDKLPDAPLFLLANEFFDALPVRQFIRRGAGWAEVEVGVRDGALCLGQRPVAGGLDARLADTTEGDVVEICAALPAITAAIGTRIAACGGAALIVDYGGWRSLGDTVQALRAHRPEGILANPGQADLTAHVDFEAIGTHAAPAQASTMIPQGVLLERLGITARAQTLARSLEGAALQAHVAAHRRLTHADEMGHLFKAMALAPAGGPLPPGFSPWT